MGTPTASTCPPRSAFPARRVKLASAGADVIVDAMDRDLFPPDAFAPAIGAEPRVSTPAVGPS